MCTAGNEPNEDGNLCVDIDECADSPCAENFDCINGSNQFTCDCNTARFDLVGDVCQDKNECDDPMVNCPADSNCVNTVGSYECQCITGFGPVGESSIPTEVVCDLNECLTETCNTNASCQNTVGSFDCICDSGWEALSGFSSPLEKGL